MGATATVTDPGNGGSIDVNVLNKRNWIDVKIVAPAGRVLDLASIRDLAPEFLLSGAGLGSIALDGTRAPTLVTQSGTVSTWRYWLTGTFANTAVSTPVTVTFLANAWSFAITPASGIPVVTLPTVITAPATGLPTVLVITLPTGSDANVPDTWLLDVTTLENLGALFVDKSTGVSGLAASSCTSTPTGWSRST